MRSLELLSKYRSEIMGFAITWIFLAHIFPYETNCGYDILKIGAYFGYAGVDIFLFISGFGLYHGFPKYKTKNEFYKKRFFRIIPTYVLFIIITLLCIGKFNIVNFLSLFFDLGWYFPNSELLYYNWYMSAIMFLYLMFPLYIKYFKISPLKSTIYTSISALLFTFLLARLGSINTAIVTTRIPIFLLGIYASYLFDKKDINIHENKLMIISFISLILTFLYLRGPWFDTYKYILIWNYGFYWIPFIFITPGLLVILTKLFDYFSKSFPQILSVLKFLGIISLEIYLIHVNEFLLEAVKSISDNQTIYFIIILLLSLIGGVIIHKLMKPITSRQ